MEGFPELDTLSPDRNRLWNRTKVITQLFPGMKFGCSGTIVRLRARATMDQMKSIGMRVPKVQIWRKNKNRYFKQGPDIPVVGNTSVCIRDRHDGNIFRCTLTEAFQVSVQPGDILGLELPPQNNDGFDIYFKTGGQLNYVFEGPVNCTVNISKAARQSYDLPQINLVVVLGT